MQDNNERVSGVIRKVTKKKKRERLRFAIQRPAWCISFSLVSYRDSAECTYHKFSWSGTLRNEINKKNKNAWVFERTSGKQSQKKNVRMNASVFDISTVIDRYLGMAQKYVAGC
jgi:predicted CopG family antitoxin